MIPRGGTRADIISLSKHYRVAGAIRKVFDRGMVKGIRLRCQHPATTSIVARGLSHFLPPVVEHCTLAT